MASSDILSQTLHSITQTKLRELSKKHANFESGKTTLLKDVDAESLQRERVLLLLNGRDELPFMSKLEANSSLDSVNVRRFLAQSQTDPAVSLKLQKQWECELRSELDIQSLRFEYASLYGRLVTEWLSNPNNEQDIASDSSSFEKVGRKEMHEQRAMWEEYVFKTRDTDTAAIEKYLDEIFNSNKHVQKALSHLRNIVADFEKEIARETSFDEKSLTWCIKGLLTSDVLTDAKKQVLNDFLGNKVVLSELADVLNMRIQALDTWAWADEATPIEQRRQLNGRYRFYHDEDLLQSIFFRYIGVRWSVFIKGAFTGFIQAEGTWKSSTTSVTVLDQARRTRMLDTNHRRSFPVEKIRQDLWRDHVFLEQLQTSVNESHRAYDGNDNEPGDIRKTPQEVVQSVLHLLVSDIIMKTRLGEDVTVVRSDFKWFGPSLPYSTIFTVLKYFGTSHKWISFFQRALEAPMKFIKDGDDAPVQIRKRGTPISGPFSDFLGESVLFCLDFAMNQQTDGTQLYRLHDDIWYWGTESTCATGWATMSEFTKLMGLEFNEDKTGSVCISKNRHSSLTPDHRKSTLLPKGDVKWGFLKLDTSGRFVIDEAQVDEHIEELRLQLKACNSVFDWIQAWNIYAARFFTVNFGRPAQCNGRAHVEMMLAMFQRIQEKLFANETVSSATDKVKSMITERFGVQDVPEGYLYFPMSMGGLDLRDPFIELYQIHQNLIQNPDKIMDDFFEAEEGVYNRAKKMWETHTTTQAVSPPGFPPIFPPPPGFGSRLQRLHDDEDFMSFEEFTRYRQQTSIQLGEALKTLISEPEVHKISITKDVSALLDCGELISMKAYTRWVVQLYGSEMIKYFGGLDVVEKGLLPTGMVSMMFRQSRFQWQG